jgi:glycosyltransferase involved in cell wall biosynthesis
VKALHVFPMFGPELGGGSDYVQFHLSRELARSGVEVEVLATCTRALQPLAAFGLGWPSDYPAGAALVDGMRIRRFPVSWSPPPAIAHGISRLIIDRWGREEVVDPAGAKGSETALAALQRRALTRPAVYDYLALVGRGPHSRQLVAAARRAVRECDIVLAGFMPFATLWYTTRLARRCDKPIVLLPLFHPEDIYHHFRLFYRCFAEADALLAQTAYSAALFERCMPGARPIEVGIGVDPEEFADARVSGARFRQRYGLGDARLVLFVGRKEMHKRYDLAVEAVERLADDRVRLVLIGADVDRAPLASGRAVHLGMLSRAELLDAYDACEIFVLPSEHESFGIVFLEAWMRGKPVIGSARCRPVASLITDRVDGLLADGAAELAAHLGALLADPERGRRLGEAGRAKVLARYTWDHIGRTVRALYDELVGRRSRQTIGAGGS